MKKVIFSLLVFAGFSAFALNPKCCKKDLSCCHSENSCAMMLQKLATKAPKTTAEKAHKPSGTPLTDLFMFPLIGG